MAEIQLTESETEVLHYLTIEFLTVKQIATRRKTGVKAVYEIVRGLKSKGVLTAKKYRYSSIGNIGGGYSEGVGLLRRGDENDKLRLHSEQFILTPISKDKNFPPPGTHLIVKGNRVHFYKDYIELFGSKTLSFWGSDPGEIINDSWDYWLSVFSIIENNYGCVLLKDRKTNIRRVKSHLSKTDSSEAKTLSVKGDKLRVFGDKDGKLSYLIDNSFNLNEFEAVHPLNFSEDMTRAEKHFNDWKNNDPITLTQLSALHKSLIQEVRVIAGEIRVLVDLIPRPPEVSEAPDDKLYNYFG